MRAQSVALARRLRQIQLRGKDQQCTKGRTIVVLNWPGNILVRGSEQRFVAEGLPMNRHAVLAGMLAFFLLAGCASVPLDVPKNESTALTDTGDTYLAQQSLKWRSAAPDRDGFYPLTEGLDAFGARLALMERAERTIDAQYFMMSPDTAGLVFVAELMKAADRGVRVRLLLDDIFTTVDDSVFILLDQHPNVEMRLFNPIARKGVYAFNYVGNFKLTNRRMHNKSLTMDNQIAVIGGRNIAEEYFQLEEGGEFIDFDVMAAGPIVEQISASFDDYWNHELAIPMSVFYEEVDADDLESLQERLPKAMADVGDSVYASAINSELMQQFRVNKLRPYIADARMIVDEPQKLLEEISRDYQIVAKEISEALLAAEKEIIIYTPYFIPGKSGLEVINRIREKGVRIVIITNSLATNNHTSVHSAYSSYRKRLLEQGVELWEARVDAADVTLDDGTKEKVQLTLHTKGIIIDSRYVFVGSLNLDPRSIDINTEMGVLIDSVPLATRAVDSSRTSVPNYAYQLKLDEKGKIRWYATIDGQDVVETKEPNTSGWMRFKAWFLKIAPEKQL
jgi:putative cardiolipin synthase